MYVVDVFYEHENYMHYFCCCKMNCEKVHFLPFFYCPKLMDSHV